ncbi:MgtC/SapB family protein [Catelliglobosispora koreensis]|uniref:MgtC/SapB family protein n=1 Tax=Catelliglobosispora koreensis TaxID=129052 RepID=UPI0003601CF0|nr:DUF4010 domain-containing protein [Catelliglobosispora koreensis]
MWLSVAVALAVGLMVGSERERSGHGPMTGGVRTFALASAAGCIAAFAGPGPFAAAIGATALVATAGYLRRADPEDGATTEIALILTTVIGGAAARWPALAAALGVATAVLLVSKQRLHRFVRQSITDTEVADALKFFVVALIVLPLIPHSSIGPYGAIDPRRVWTLVVAVTGLSWLGYLAIRVLGARHGLVLAGLAGGFVSGSVTTAAMARQAKVPSASRAALAGALMASVATLVQLIMVTAVADARVTATLWPAAAAGAVILLAEAVWLAWRSPHVSPSELPVRRPFAFIPAIVLAATLSAFLVISRFAEDVFGAAATQATVAAAGLADAHAGALTAATLSAGAVITVPAAAIAALYAVAVNTVVKLVLAWIAGGPRVAVSFALLMAAPVAAVAVVAVVTLGT